ncbi:MAG TPA: hypothetical protein VKC89_02585 [Patescibacteria group bacterium]|nr:hypothetical protein [Patescibacteria group bacterium]
MKNNLGSILIFLAVLTIAAFALYVMLFKRPETAIAPSASNVQRNSGSELQDLNSANLNTIDQDLQYLDSESSSI